MLSAAVMGFRMWVGNRWQLPPHLHRRHLLLGLLGGHLEDGAALLLQHAPVALQLAQLLAALCLEARRLVHLAPAGRQQATSTAMKVSKGDSLTTV